MEGQARTTTKRAGSNPWLAGVVIGHGGVIGPTENANSSRSFGRCCDMSVRNYSPASGSLVPLHPVPQFRGLGAEIFFVFLVFTCHRLLRWILGLKCWASTQWWTGEMAASSLCRAQPRGCNRFRLAICPWPACDGATKWRCLVHNINKISIRSPDRPQQ
ncbi:uncharacterized protein BDV17DRAFT_66588 [Aspergillus undulatus]|uniref:uncharacterized protein n=1 Tax=Aspergillus undulatus TaxID=1810928 RepID=UPI003CCE256D